MRDSLKPANLAFVVVTAFAFVWLSNRALRAVNLSEFQA